MHLAPDRVLMDAVPSRMSIGAAPWLEFRSLLRKRWRVWLGLALLVGATAGGAMAGLAGAKRTASAHDRFLDRHRAANLIVAIDCDPPSSSAADIGPDEPLVFDELARCVDEVAELPSVEDVAIVEIFPASIAAIEGRSVLPEQDPCYTGPGVVVVVGDRSGRFGAELNEIRIIDGRRADPAAADEVVLAKATADRLGLGPGSLLRASLFDGAACEDGPAAWLPPVTLRVVGIGLTPSAIPAAIGGLHLVRPRHAGVHRRAAVDSERAWGRGQAPRSGPTPRSLAWTSPASALRRGAE